jgi:hypothetical protein
MANDGGPAFARSGFAPQGVGYEDCGITDDQTGMTLRDYFAAKAMNGILSDPEVDCGEGQIVKFAAQIAKVSYQYADAMLEARSK